MVKERSVTCLTSAFCKAGGDDGEDQYSVGRKVNEVDYQSGDDDGANDPWTPPV